jgi:uncharacterized lipoprotein YmbA
MSWPRSFSFVVLGSVVLGSILGVGCGLPPSTHYYVLTHPERDPVASMTGRTAAGWHVGVAAFDVDPPYDQDRIVYRVGASSPEVGFYTYHRWATPLSRMLPGIVAEALRDIPGIASLEPISTGRRYDATIEGRIVSLEEIDTADRQTVRARLILRLRSFDGTELWSENLEATGTIQDNTVAEVVAEMSRTLATALDRVGEAVSRELQQLDSNSDE